MTNARYRVFVFLLNLLRPQLPPVKMIFLKSVIHTHSLGFLMTRFFFFVLCYWDAQMVVHMHRGRFSSRPETLKPAFMHVITHKSTQPTVNVSVCVNRDDVTILNYLIIVPPEKHRASLSPASSSSTNTLSDLMHSDSATLIGCRCQIKAATCW